LKPRPQIPTTQEKRCSLEQKSDLETQNTLNFPEKSPEIPGGGGIFDEITGDLSGPRTNLSEV
jgi:hypothetical protein